MRKDAWEEKKKKKKDVELVRTQRTIPAYEESTSSGVTERSKIPSPYEEWDEEYMNFLETYKGTEDREGNVQELFL